MYKALDSPKTPRQADMLVEKSAHTLTARLRLIARQKMALWKAIFLIMFIAGFASALVWVVNKDYSPPGEAKGVRSDRRRPPPVPESPLVSIHARPEEVEEGRKDVCAQFLVRRKGGEQSQLVVNYLIRGTATLNEDYRLSPPPLTIPAIVVIPAGEDSAPLVLEVIDDRIKEKEERVTLVLVRDPSHPTYVIGASKSRATIEIEDND